MSDGRGARWRTYETEFYLALCGALSTKVTAIHLDDVHYRMDRLRILEGWRDFGIKGNDFFCCCASARMLRWTNDGWAFLGVSVSMRNKICSDEGWSTGAFDQLAEELLRHVRHERRA